MDDESYFWSIIYLFSIVVGLIGTIFCFRFMEIEYSTSLLILWLIMLCIFLFGFLSILFMKLLDLFDWLDKKLGG